MGSLRERSRKVIRQEDINPENIERIFQDLDENVKKIDKRRISQQTPLSSTAELADVVTSLNALLNALNASDLTED